jgi:hypothetical protein
MDARLVESGAFEQNSPEAPFEMTHLYPKTTGLPMTIWVSAKGGARHDARVKVCRMHGNRMNMDELSVVSVRPEPQLLEGDLSKADLDAVTHWIRLNEAALLAHWDGLTDGVELALSLKRLDG